ncbi:hypothetical protein H634G_00892 [Metarhizium anisopliae BRIP 53293]|uniref:Uncharacterized protein n=1 Tax=Metarhizium anisopliae BRIP 53293 TaxID=1291518 RepID=A0A0D9PBM7_METAN|nr:hypothetical protein H634G_00892 [Metarhizium anisopliae BRIP 53293]KJK92555.1 hypothetical protein H633G_03597 [Metarhizium anisopliae BRIP 53284]
MPSAGAVYNGSAPPKPDHAYTNHGIANGEQNLGNDRLTLFFERDPYSNPSGPASREAQVAAQLKAVSEAFQPTQ